MAPPKISASGNTVSPQSFLHTAVDLSIIDKNHEPLLVYILEHCTGPHLALAWPVHRVGLGQGLDWNRIEPDVLTR